MRLALGITVHTGWAACVVASGSVRQPHIALREHVELLGDPERFLFHRAAEAKAAEASGVIAAARETAMTRATAVVGRLSEGRELRGCAVVAKAGAIPAVEDILASHPLIHRAEGMFYRDVLLAAAEACGLEVTLMPPSTLDVKGPALAAAGKVVGKPWASDWKLAALAAWSLLERGGA